MSKAQNAPAPSRVERNASRPAERSVLLIGFEHLDLPMLRAVLRQSTLLQVIGHNVPAERMEQALAAHEPDAAVVRQEAVDTASLQSAARAFPGTGFVLLANSLSAEQAGALMRCGAAAALERSLSPHLLTTATIAAAFGMRTEPRAGSEDEGNPARLESAEPGIASLSSREAEVLGLLECHEQPSMIAEILSVSTHTVKSQIQSIYRKLGVHSREELREHRTRVCGDRAGAGELHANDETGELRVDIVRTPHRRERRWKPGAFAPGPRWLRT